MSDKAIPSNLNAAVLAIHPDSELRNLMQGLEAIGVELFCADTLDLGIQQLHVRIPDLVLLDDGGDIAQLAAVNHRLKSEGLPSRVPVLAVVAAEYAGNLNLLSEAGIDDVVLKPLRPAEIEWRVRRCLMAEDKLWASEQSFRAVIDHSPDTIVRYDEQCRRLYVSHAYLKTYGMAGQKVVGKKPSETPWHSNTLTAEDFEAAILSVFRSGQATDIELDWNMAGEQTHHWVRAVPERDRHDKVVSVLAIIRDTSEMKRTESLLRRREFEFRTLAHNSPDMIIRYDMECRQAYLNPAFERFTGTALADAWNKTPAEAWNALTPCDDYLSRLKGVMETGKPDQILLEWVMPDQSVSTLLLHAVAEHDEEGNTIGALVIGHNITELKASERHLEESRAQLQMLTYHREEAREGERKRIAREIHDELGQLLSVLRLGISTLDYGYGDTNPDLRNKTAKMGAVVDQAIDMVHTLATRLRPAVLESGIALALEWLVQEFSKSTGIDCELSVPDEDIDFDKERALPVFRIVQESLTNILRHSQADHVEIELTQDQEHLKLSIHDNGQGFEVSKATKKGSFGIIGMHERILMLGGTLEISSSSEHGTEIRLEVPLKIKEENRD